nr:hypothetical protein [Bacilli bacterium]
MEGILRHSSPASDNWVIDLDGEELAIVKNHLSMSESEKMQTVLSAAKILGQCPNPNGRKIQKTGLAIGKVQSGKTSNFISLAALAFDNGYRIVVIFGGNTKVLLSQTEKRINESFDLDSREDYKFSTFSSSGDLNSDALKNNYASRKNIIITGLKEYTHIRNIKRFIKDAGLSDVPILIIDDEGDQMSLNGSVNKDEETTTYRNFKELLIDLNFSTFISVTATPQANLLIDICNILSPDFIELIQPGEKYCGFSTYHYKPVTEYISIIPDYENVILDEESGIPASFEEAVSTFYVGSIIRKRRGDNTTHSMLIHPSQKIKDHSIVVRKLEILLNQLKDYIESGEESAISKVEKFLSRGLNNLKETVPESYNSSDLIGDFKAELYNTSTIVLNGTNANNEVDYKSNRNVIVLGGTMVERGLTIKNLAVTYIVRSNKGKENADTVEQRTRWFGYRTNKYGSYLDLCRVFLTDSMANNFYNLGQHEKSIWDNIIYSKKQGIVAKKMQLLFELDGHFNPTRLNVIPEMSKFEFGKWKQQKSVGDLVDTGYYKILNKELYDYLRKYNFERIYMGNFVHKCYLDVDFEDFYHTILSKFYSNKDLKFDIDYIRASISRMKMEGMPLKINIIKMRDGIDEYREIYDDKTVHQLMAGRSVNKTEDDSGYYKGDQFVLENELQIQIHNVKINKNSSETIPMLCFYCPYLGSAKRLVGRI